MACPYALLWWEKLLGNKIPSNGCSFFYESGYFILKKRGVDGGGEVCSGRRLL